MTDGIEATSDFISSYLIDFNFPVIFYYSPLRQGEAQAAYKLSLLIYTLDLTIKNYFEDLINNYDFSLLKNSKPNQVYDTFDSMLTKVSSVLSLIIKS